jgi:polysaccharide biosynthesis/export protein
MTARRGMAAVMLTAVALLLPGWAGGAEPAVSKPPAAAAARRAGEGASVKVPPAAGGEYRIGPEDLLDIAVWNNTAISRTVPVRPDGKISLPLLNDVQAAGLTPMQLRDALAKRLAEYMPTPEVSVIVREVHSFKVSVIGEVKKAGQYELKSRATVLDAIALAGGFTEFAARRRIVILRPNGGAVTRVAFNYNKAVGSEVPPEELFLRPGDVVVVP